jgi:ActR/RegA family two-component response regulator
MLQPLRSPFHSGLDSVFILYTHYPDFKDCVQAIKAGAFDYLQKEASHRSLLQSCAAGLEEKRDWTDDADAAFVQNSWSDLVEKHGEKWIAVSGGRVIAVHGHLQGLYGQLREDYPQAKPYIIRLERESVLSV